MGLSVGQSSAARSAQRCEICFGGLLPRTLVFLLSDEVASKQNECIPRARDMAFRLLASMRFFCWIGRLYVGVGNMSFEIDCMAEEIECEGDTSDT